MKSWEYKAIIGQTRQYASSLFESIPTVTNTALCNSKLQSKDSKITNKNQAKQLVHGGGGAVGDVPQFVIHSLMIAKQQILLQYFLDEAKDHACIAHKLSLSSK